MYRFKSFRVWIYTLLPFDRASYSLVVVVQPINLNSCAFGMPCMYLEYKSYSHATSPSQKLSEKRENTGPLL